MISNKLRWFPTHLDDFQHTQMVSKTLIWFPIHSDDFQHTYMMSNTQETKLYRKSKYTFYVQCPLSLLWKSSRLWDNMERHCTAEQATHDTITWRMQFTCWISLQTHTQNMQYVNIAFPQWQRSHERASLSCFMRILPVSFLLAR